MPFTRFDRRISVFNTRSLFRRVIFSVIVALLAAPALYRSYAVLRSDRIVRAEQTAESFTRALEYDPRNADLWWKRGRLHHYTMGEIDIARAIDDYRHALSLNPRLGRAWVDLAGCYEQLLKFEESEGALEKAFAVHPYSPLIRWQAGNFFLRQGNLPRMYECFKTASRYDRHKLGMAIELSWKIEPNREDILQKLIPDDLSSNMSYLDFLVKRNELNLAGLVWQRLLKSSMKAEFDFTPSAVFKYIDRLLVENRVREALTVWDDTLRKARTGLTDTRRKEPDIENFIWNGSFEKKVLLGGFDWRYSNTEALQFQIDASNRMTGLKSLHIKFGGANLSSGFLSQIVPILQPGSYMLDFCLQTENLTTDRTPYLSIQGYPNARDVSARSGLFPSTTAWRKVSVPFYVPEGCKAARVILRRDRSLKFDNKIEGTLRVDAFSIRRVDGGRLKIESPRSRV